MIFVTVPVHWFALSMPYLANLSFKNDHYITVFPILPQIFGFKISCKKHRARDYGTTNSLRILLKYLQGSARKYLQARGVGFRSLTSRVINFKASELHTITRRLTT